MTEETAIATADAMPLNLNGVLNAIVSKVATEGVYTTFAIESRDDQKRLFNSRQDCKLLRDFAQTPLKIVDMVFAPSTITDEAGNEKTMLGVYLLDQEGNSYLSTSNGVVKSAVDIITAFGEPSTWNEPLTVVCKETNTAKGRRFKFLAVE